MEIRVLDSYAAIAPADWDALLGPGDSPFLEHTFLATLETLGDATPRTGWTPRPVAVFDGGRLVAAAPAWVKTHSMGEFVYDHGWADAAHRAGLRYYPKLVVAVPFTPVTGRRLLTAPDGDRERLRDALLQGLQAAAEGCRGLHVLFDGEEESDWLAARGGFPRLQYQFQWRNEGYGSFEDWLSTFPSKKRNKIRRERKDLGGLRVEATTSPGPDLLDALHRFYTNTAGQFGPWGHVYLSRETFRTLGERWGERLHLVTARDGDRIVAGAFNVWKGDRLYGRYWGCDEQVRFLHFEVCYYRAIEECITRGLAVFEPGHGGGHKYRRGFAPVLTRSNHWLADPRLHDALRRFSAQEAEHVRAEADALRAHLDD